LNESEDFKGLSQFMRDHIKDNLMSEWPCVFEDDTEKDIAIFEAAIKKMVDLYNHKLTEDVKPAFQKFDTDESGTIEF